MSDDGAGKDMKRRLSWWFPIVALMIAAAIAATYGICRACGFADDVSHLFTVSSASPSGPAVRAAVFVTLHLCFVLLAPVLMIAAVLFVLVQFFFLRAASSR